MNDEIFLCCLRVVLGTGIKVMILKCMQCRSISQKKCIHESACIKVLSEAGTVNVNENGELQEEQPGAEHNGEPRRTFQSGSRYSRYELDCDTEDDSKQTVRDGSLTEGHDIMTVPENIAEVRVTSRKCMYEPKHWFAS